MNTPISTITSITTHSGEFHPDDVFAAALLTSVFGSLPIVRTRDEEVLEAARVDASVAVIDVGGVYDTDQNNFDHHQEGGAGTRDNGVPFSSFGLVWARFGAAYCRKFISATGIDLSAEELAQRVDEEFVQGVDAVDCGVVEPVYKPVAKDTDTPVNITGLTRAIFDLNPQPLVWSTADHDTAFITAMETASTLLVGVVESCAAKLLGPKLIRAGRLESERLVVVDHNVPDWSDVVSAEFDETLFYLEPDQSTDGAYMVWQVPTEPRAFTGRLQLPEEWAGKRGDELTEISGIDQAMFVHGFRFCGGAFSRDAAIAMAKKVIEMNG